MFPRLHQAKGKIGHNNCQIQQKYFPSFTHFNLSQRCFTGSFVDYPTHPQNPGDGPLVADTAIAPSIGAL